MATITDMKNINKLARIIANEGAIDKYNLVMKAEISISLYDKLKPFLERIYNSDLQYDTKTKIWKSLKRLENAP